MLNICRYKVGWQCYCHSEIPDIQSIGHIGWVRDLEAIRASLSFITDPAMIPLPLSISPPLSMM